MPTYTLPRQNWQGVKGTLFKVLALVALAAIGPLAMVYAMAPTMFIFLLVAYAVVVAIAIVLGISRRSRSELTIDQNRLTLKYPGKPDVTILRSDIQTIMEKPESGITVISSTTGGRIFISSDLTGYELVRNELSTWRPIEPETQADTRPLVLMISLIALSGIAAVGAFLFRIKALFYVFVATFLIIMVMGMVNSFKTQTERKQKAGPFGRILLVLLTIYFVYKVIESLLR
jgi:hypothetical protein